MHYSIKLKSAKNYKWIKEDGKKNQVLASKEDILKSSQNSKVMGVGSIVIEEEKVELDSLDPELDLPLPFHEHPVNHMDLSTLQIL